MATRSATHDDPRHYTAADGRILPVGGTHAKGEACDRCSLVATRPNGFTVGERVLFGYGRRGRVQGLISKIGRRYVTVSWTSRSGKRHESNRLPSEVTRIATVRA